jgi:hypothetical protein
MPGSIRYVAVGPVSTLRIRRRDVDRPHNGIGHITTILFPGTKSGIIDDPPTPKDSRERALRAAGSWRRHSAPNKRPPSCLGVCRSPNSARSDAWTLPVLLRPFRMRVKERSA